MTDALIETATIATATKDSGSRTVTSGPSSLTQVLPEPHGAEITSAADGSALSKAAKPSRPRWGAWATAGWLLVVILVGAQMETLSEIWVGKISESEVAAQIVQFVGELATVAVLFLAAYLSQRPVADYLGLIRPRRGHVIAIALVGFGSLIASPLVWLVLAPAVGFRVSWPTAGGALPTDVLTWVRSGFFAPFAEELLCRGFLYRGFAQSRLGATGAIMLTAALFTSFHLTEFVDSSVWYLDVLRITAIGLLFGWLRERTGSVLPTWGIHTLVNAVEVPVLGHLLAGH
jgi:membrane protease YdiL (CAAX protease family)